MTKQRNPAFSTWKFDIPCSVLDILFNSLPGYSEPPAARRVLRTFGA